MARGALFDKDGTLIDFEATWHPIVLASLDEAAGRFSVPREVIASIMRGIGVNERGFERESLIQGASVTSVIAVWMRALAEAGIRVDAAELKAIFLEAAAKAPIRVTKGARELLEALRREGFRLGLVTADDRRSAEGSMRAAGLLDCFDYVAADGEGRPSKPDPAAAREFRSLFGVDGSLAMFGDSVVDMDFAHNAGADFIGMRTGCNAHERFSEAGHPVIDDFGDTEAVLALLSRPVARG